MIEITREMLVCKVYYNMVTVFTLKRGNVSAERGRDLLPPHNSQSCRETSRGHPSQALLPDSLGALSPCLQVRAMEGTGPDSRRRRIVERNHGLCKCLLYMSRDGPGPAGKLRRD